MKELFRRFSNAVSRVTGTAWSFVTALSIVFVWILTGPIFDYSNTWQLVINTFTTVVTFLMVFLIQNTQSRDTRSIQLKLDELLRSIKSARDQMVDIEEITDQELDEIQEEFRVLREKTLKKIENQKKVSRKK